MTIREHFPTTEAQFAFARELITVYPARCTDELGNTCVTVRRAAENLADDVNYEDITEDTARELAKISAEDVALNCKFGYQKRGYAAVCAYGIEE